jgi:hypothetical protein
MIIHWKTYSSLEVGTVPFFFGKEHSFLWLCATSFSVKIILNCVSTSQKMKIV